jgi:hypothetical protein
MTKTESYGELHSRMKKMAGHTDEKEDRKLVSKMVKKDALTGRCNGGKRADGGRAEGGKAPKKGGKPNISITVAPRSGGDRAGPPESPMPMPVPAGAMPSRTAGPVIPPPGPGGPAAGLAALRAMPPVGAKRGGKVSKRADGGAAGAGGSLMGSAPSRALSKLKSLPPENNGLVNAKRGGKVKGYDAGAGSGDGRLEKSAHMKRLEGKPNPKVK